MVISRRTIGFGVFGSRTIGGGAIISGGGSRSADQGDDLYSPDPNLLLASAPLWVPDVADEMLAYFRRHPEKMYDMASRKFEELIAAVFRNQGFQVELTPKTRDGGFDVLAVSKDQFTGKSSFLVECKRHRADNKIGVGIVRSLLGVVDDQRATKGIVATTSYFTRDAKQFEERNCNLLTLKDYEAVKAWLDDLSLSS